MEIGRSVEEVRHLAACACFDLSCAVSALNAVISDSHIKPTLSYFDLLKILDQPLFVCFVFLFFCFVVVFLCVCVNSLCHCRLSALSVAITFPFTLLVHS